MTRPLPGGAGIYFKKNGDKFEIISLLRPSNWSFKAVHWLEYINATQFKDHVIRHAMNGGEKSFKLDGVNFKADGFCEIDGVKHWFFFHGCYYHYCDCQKSVDSPERLKKIQDDERLRQICSKYGKYYEIFECKFDAMKVKMESNRVSCFFNKMLTKTTVNEEQIFAKIKSGEFYGFVSCDIRSPDSVVQRWNKLWGGPIFAHVTPTEEMINPEIVAELKRRKVKIAENQLTLVYNHDSYIMTTELFLFYEKIGMKMSNLQWAVEFTKDTPCRQFVEKMTDLRKKAEREGNSALVELFKLVVNSSYGSLGLNVKKHLNHKYKRLNGRKVRSEGPRITGCNHLMGEFSTNWVEEVSRKSSATDTTASKYNFNLYQVISF